MSPIPRGLRGTLRLPGDKSLSHRALILGAMAEGATLVRNLAGSQDVLSTWRCLEGLGVEIERLGAGTARVRGAGRRGLRAPGRPLDCGNSGTTMRLLMGVLAGRGVEVELVGDASLSRRPMERVAAPLRSMGADIRLSPAGTAPVALKGGALKAVDFVSPVASAQVKSAVLLAGLGAEGLTSVREPSLSRDHTERMLPAFGVEVRRSGLTASVEGGSRLEAASLDIPGDVSSAMFWVAAATFAPGSRIVLEGVGLNETRTGALDALDRMGAKVRRERARPAGGLDEPVGDLVVESAGLHAADIRAAEVPRLIDEVPILALAASQARGESRFSGLSELRHKESDRLSGVADLLNRLGGQARVEGDDLVVSGPTPLAGGRVSAAGDHRIAMTAMVAALLASGPVEVDDPACAAVSYPGFLEDLSRLR